MTAWTLEDTPDQTGRTAIVTGANSGIGFEAARMLAHRGARVVLACRSLEKGQQAFERIARAQPRAQLQLSRLDLSDLSSVAGFAEQFNDRLDLLITNAGVMNTPFGRTAQGFELQLGTNHLGHFALAAQLWPLLARTPGSRLVVVTSLMANVGRIDFEDLNFERRTYQGWLAYAQSKLANSLFALELARRSASVQVTAAHPGWTATELTRGTPMIQRISHSLAMTAEQGALTTVRAALDPGAGRGSFWGPSRWLGMFGAPGPADMPGRARDVQTAQRLWELSEQLTGVRFEVAAAAGEGSVPHRQA
jgi:NAD(P)-dependent dehydrogenase (short-subunit alcohol dehydrogenase family)